MFASMPVGYNHPYVLENKDRFISPALNNLLILILFSEMAEFVKTMGRVAQPITSLCILCEGGALGVENALKTLLIGK
ncbi:MAG: hypothetical protein Ct9H300mP18_08080 [Candidatus Neomarinimicrobiota bacterium]|nr:MAG: hypothetical protein Ct9H300mP18_08080 [Candidatus Neomarinimicrobiota bacterium]